MLIVALGCLAFAAQLEDNFDISDGLSFGEVECSDDLGLPTPAAYNTTTASPGGSWWLSAESTKVDERSVSEALRQNPGAVELVDEAGASYAFTIDDQGVSLRVSVPSDASAGTRFLLRTTETWDALPLEVGDETAAADFEVRALNVVPRVAAACRAVCTEEETPWPESAVLELTYSGGPAILDVLTDGALLEGAFGPRRYVDSVLLPQADDTTVTWRLKAHDIESVELSASVRIRDVDSGALRLEQSFAHSPELSVVGEERAYDHCEELNDDFCFDDECGDCSCDAGAKNTTIPLLLAALGVLGAVGARRRPRGKAPRRAGPRPVA